MRFKLLVIGAAIAVVATTVGISGFTSATVERQADINVANDDSGLLALEPGGEEEVFTGTDGELAIDMSKQKSVDGLNQNATFTFGNQSNANETFAFNVTNNDNITHTVDFGYTVDDDKAASDGTENLNFVVYNNTGNKLGSFNETSDFGGTELTPDETFFVVLEVDTSGLSENDNLKGTLKVTA